MTQRNEMSRVDQHFGRGGLEQFSAVGNMLGEACVVIVDDQPANVQLLKRLIRSAGVPNVHGVIDPREAVRRCQEVDADLLLLDLHMPHMDGFAVMAELRATLPHGAFLPVLVLTADSTTVTRDRALYAGAKDFLTKPFDHTEVVLRVNTLLETRALYAAVQRHNAALQADLDARAAEERRRTAEHRRRLDRVNDALHDNAPTMVFQPIADLHTGEVRGLEALARFLTEPRRPPNKWFDEAAAVGRGPDLELVAAAGALSQFDDLPPESFVAVNVSPATASNSDLASMLDPFPADRIVLEMTEHAPIDDYEPLLTSLDVLRHRGIRIAVDDAGAGYSGLRHVLRLRPDILKLDTALTRGIDADPARRALATAMVSFAYEIGAVIIAEGIETWEELDCLRDLGIPWGQGYHLARPDGLPLAAGNLDAVLPS